MKTTILVLLLSTTISAQKISQETYNGLVSRQYKPIMITASEPLFVIIGNERQDISTAGWDWPSNSSYNQYYWSLYYSYNYGGLRFNDLYYRGRLSRSRDMGTFSAFIQERMVLSERRRGFKNKK